MNFIIENIINLYNKYSKLPFTDFIVENYNIDKKIQFGLISAISLYYLAFGIFVKYLSIIVSLLYPVFKTFLTLESDKADSLRKKWLTYWMVNALLISIETIAWFFVTIIPMYYLLKIFFVYWLTSPKTNGCLYIYNNLIEPYLKNNKEYIESMLEKTEFSIMMIGNNINNINNINNKINEKSNVTMKKINFFYFFCIYKRNKMNKNIAVIKIQRYWRSYQLVKFLKKFNKFNLKEKSLKLSFDDFTKLLINKEILKVTGYLIYYFQYNFKINFKINNRILLTAYLFSNYANEILGDENKRNHISQRINYFSSELISSLNYDNNKKQLEIIGNNILNYSVTFSVWKMQDKSEMIQKMIKNYYYLGDHIDKIKSNELSGNDDMIDELKNQQKDILDSIKLIDRTFDISYFKQNYKMIYESIELNYKKLNESFSTNMKLAYYDYIKKAYEDNDFKPVIDLINDIKKRLLNIMISPKRQESFNDKFNFKELTTKTIIRFIIQIVETIGSLQAPIDDESFNLWKQTIVNRLSKENEKNYYEIIPEILIQAEEKIDKIYSDLLKLK